MENYYSLALLCGVSLIAAIAIWLSKLQEKKEEKGSAKSSFARHSTTTSLFRDYSYNSFCNQGNLLLSNLKDVCLYDSKTRPINPMDRWYKDNTANLSHDGACLAYINHYGYLEDTFWKNVKELGIDLAKDKSFQRILVSVCKTSLGYYQKNFSNMLFHFARYYTLLPEIDDIIQNDERFAEVKATYNLGRDMSQKERLKAEKC